MKTKHELHTKRGHAGENISIDLFLFVLSFLSFYLNNHLQTNGPPEEFRIEVTCREWKVYKKK